VTLIARFRRYLLNTSLKNTQLALRFGVCNTTITYWRTGKTYPNFDKLDQLEVFLSNAPTTKTAPAEILFEAVNRIYKETDLWWSEIARLCGIHSIQLSYWLNHGRVPGSNALAKIDRGNSETFSDVSLSLRI
jgi:transposase-like protein